MSRLRKILLDRYREWYARLNVNIDPRLRKRRYLKATQRTFGNLVAPLEEGSKVLDLGCGTGFLTYWLSLQKGIVPVGVDISASQVEAARQCMPGIEIHCVDGLEFLKENNEEMFSGIFCLDVLEHIPSEDLCLEWVEATRNALKPGGFTCYKVPNAANLISNRMRYVDMTHERLFTSDSLIQLIEAGGFEDTRIVPIRAAHLIGKIRLAVEILLHKVIYLICGVSSESVFTTNLCVVGFKELC